MKISKMKKTIGVLACLVFAVAWLPGAGATSAAVELPLRIEYQGERIAFPDEQPYVDKAQRVQVPVRFVSEALGADVKWAPANQSVTIKLDNNEITLIIGQKLYNVNGKVKEMDTAARRINGRTFVPIRFVTEGLGAYVKWDAAVRTAYISDIPFDPEEEKEPSENKAVEENMYGFKVKHNTGSTLEIEKGSNEQYYPVVSMMIYFPEMREGADYERQVKEVEEILLQKIDKKTVQEAIQYIKKKTDWEQEIELKVFKDSNYSVYIASHNSDPIDVSVYEIKE
ncbi:copper amine oxidase N-terminal domain-containing protein [Paenibacillus oralis]|uniref:Copper amine oxidase N-terminal domain-containing protein n=1 Tax=Paenibacillus oralis TaxID=2490856 RepID=A0A3P3U1G2_9BACL|nr:copper amine oxidase N-terminal domain-containing protein [Paenibacillus oralis]RRJ63438.1 copper amine oxidase N-terminal domain-containing protein [Paenibacillus oralis]